MSSMTKAYMANGNQRLEAYTYTHTTQHTNMAYRQFRKGKTSSIFTVLFFHFYFFRNFVHFQECTTIRSDSRSAKLLYIGVPWMGSVFFFSFTYSFAFRRVIPFPNVDK